MSHVFSAPLTFFGSMQLRKLDSGVEGNQIRLIETKSQNVHFQAIFQYFDLRAAVNGYCLRFLIKQTLIKGRWGHRFIQILRSFRRKGVSSLSIKKTTLAI